MIVSDFVIFVIFSLAIVNLKFEIEKRLANWSPIVIKLHLEYEIPICHVSAQSKSRQSWKDCAVRDDNSSQKQL